MGLGIREREIGKAVMEIAEVRETRWIKDGTETALGKAKVCFKQNLLRSHGVRDRTLKLHLYSLQGSDIMLYNTSVCFYIHKSGL